MQRPPTMCCGHARNQATISGSHTAVSGLVPTDSWRHPPEPDRHSKPHTLPRCAFGGSPEPRSTPRPEDALLGSTVERARCGLLLAVGGSLRPAGGQSRDGLPWSAVWGRKVNSMSTTRTRQCPPTVRKAGTLPAAIQRHIVDSSTPIRRAASAAEMRRFPALTMPRCHRGT